MAKTGPKLKWNLEIALEMRNLSISYSNIARYLKVKPVTIQTYFLKHYGKLPYNTNTSKSRLLDGIEKQVLFGTLLGDGNLRIDIKNKSKNTSGKIEHCQKQIELLKLKKEIFGNLCSEIKEISRFDKRTNKTYHSCYIRFKTNPELNEFHSMFYENNKKKIPHNLKLLTPLSIAIWFMDDGVKATKGGYYFSTNSFTKEDTERLAKELENRYNLNTSLHYKGKEQYMIYIKKSSASDFEKLIENYIIPSMYYKFHSLLIGINGESLNIDNPVPNINLND